MNIIDFRELPSDLIEVVSEMAQNHWDRLFRVGLVLDWPQLAFNFIYSIITIFSNYWYHSTLCFTDCLSLLKKTKTNENKISEQSWAVFGN